eukprot:m.1266306 g.1266306  ORF g.1266306 m.1266306 type:complete len:175 (+) comp24740_c0_seq15:3220-3744(+)
MPRQSDLQAHGPSRHTARRAPPTWVLGATQCAAMPLWTGSTRPVPATARPPRARDRPASIPAGNMYTRILGRGACNISCNMHAICMPHHMQETQQRTRAMQHVCTGEVIRFLCFVVLMKREDVLLHNLKFLLCVGNYHSGAYELNCILHTPAKEYKTLSLMQIKDYLTTMTPPS